jgi:hypothetical protein
LKTTRYFDEQVLRKRPYIQVAWIAPIRVNPIRRVAQPDGRVRVWGAVVDPRDGQTRYLRVATLQHGEAIHNAFFDRDFEGRNR